MKNKKILIIFILFLSIAFCGYKTQAVSACSYCDDYCSGDFADPDDCEACMMDYCNDDGWAIYDNNNLPGENDPEFCNTMPSGTICVMQNGEEGVCAGLQSSGAAYCAPKGGITGPMPVYDKNCEGKSAGEKCFNADYPNKSFVCVSEQGGLLCRPDDSSEPQPQQYTYDQCMSDNKDYSKCRNFPGAPIMEQGADEYEACPAGMIDDPSDPTMCIENTLADMSYGTCSKNSDCGTGFTCYNKTCIDEQSYEDNTAWYERTWESVTDFFSGNGGTATAEDLMRTNSSVNIPGVGNVPVGTIIRSDGTVVGPNGDVLGRASQAEMQAMLQAAVSGTGGVTKTVTGGSGGGVSSQKCGANFEEIGGVCFPKKSVTGLSDTPISIIIANLFVWLMTIFVTLAIISFVISGIMYVTAAGDDKQTETAKKNAQKSVIGIIVGLSGYLVMKAISAALAGQVLF